MIHLDTNILIDLVTAYPPQVEVVKKWLEEGETLTASAVAWSEFLKGPHTLTQKDAVRAILQGGVRPFDEDHAEQASRLFHQTGRRRGSHSDCMIAAAALCSREPVATRNISDFERFIPHGLLLERIPTISHTP
jgi:predicted nucleic acid-binding protein